MLNHTRLLTLIVLVACAQSSAMYFPPISDAQWRLSEAIREDDMPTIKALITRTELSQNGFASPALHQAIVFEREAVVALLLAHGAHPDCVNYRGETALCKAAKMGNLKLAQMLKDAGANVNTVTDSRQTPLSCAIRGLPQLPWDKQQAMIVWLLKEKALLTKEEAAQPLPCPNPKEVKLLLTRLGIRSITVCNYSP